MDIRDAPRLAAFRGIHAGETLIVCGCGPSLPELTGQAARFTTIGVNDVGRLFDPDYLVVVNPPRQFAGDRFRHVAESRAKAIFTQLDLGRTMQAPQVRVELGQRGGTDTTGERLHFTQNSPYVAVCLAAYMGAARIALIGVDFTEHHFFARSGKHPLSGRLAQIDAEYGALAEALARRGIELINLSSQSRLVSLRKTSLAALDAPASTAAQAATATAMPAAEALAGPIARPTRRLNIVSYATSPVAGVPALLADCIAHATGHHAQCLWPSGSYGNGVGFEGGRSWGRNPQQVLETLAAADIVIVHNGKIDPAHASVLRGKRLVTLAHNYGWNVDMSHVRTGGMPGLVVGQYQATLPEFAGWGLVPNPIPLWRADHSPEPKDASRIHIAYTPSGRHERYPAGHRLYWHGKGWQTTMAVLARLARRHPDWVCVESTGQGQLSHAEALAMKRRAHIVIDECVTGSYHRNSLEGLAAGAVVVNGVGLLDGVEQALRRCAPGAVGPLPFVFSTLDGLEATLLRLLEQGPQALAAQGRANRQWMEAHWAFERQWPAFWAAACGDGATPARPAPPSITEPPAMSPQPHSSQPPLSVDPLISVVVPHGGAERLPQLMGTLASLRQQQGVRLEIVVVEMGPAPVALDCARRWSCLHLFIEHGGAFERARALNAAQPVAAGELLLWHDNDLIADPGFIAAAVQELRERRLDYLTPYSGVCYLSPADSQAVMQGLKAAAGCKPVRVLASGSGASGGAGLVRRSFLAQHGGLIEGFRGWGGEDNAWNHKIGLLGRSGHSRRPGQQMHHLHHACSGGPTPGAASAANPHYAANVELLGQVGALRQAEAFKARFPAPVPTPGLLSRFDVADEAVGAAAPRPGLAVWAYWEGPCPAWIQACLATLRAAAPATLQVLDREAFERMRAQDPEGDRDISLDRLRIAHRADYIRLYLLRRFGGLWVDADCLAMQPLQSVLDLLVEHETVGHRERSGLVSNGFLAARPGSRIIEASYARVCALLRSQRPLGWTSLGSEPLGAAVASLPSAWHELPCQRVQPVCWSEPETFLTERSEAEHAQAFDPDALCYMLSNSRIGPMLAARPGADLLKPGTFFAYLLDRIGLPTGGAASASLHERVFSQHAQLYRRHRDESISGPGSNLQQTQRLRAGLPLLLAHLGIRSLLDAPCGDFNWMRTVNLGVEQYIGVDVLGEVIAGLQWRHAGLRRNFRRLDLLDSELPRADAIFCRDLLPHLSYAESRAVLRNFQVSGATFLLTTTFTGARPNRDTADGEWRTLNLQLAPFAFAPPLLVLNEQCTEGGGAYGDKSLAVWRLDDLPLDQSGPGHGGQQALRQTEHCAD
ncbi:capsular polysaccharide synthesis protein [Roseateles sp. PN1]|uniref:capsular polysaccharide synthesis protein n=1 Tax=Roseateles sp. PN1 TaxID=3137372 RepID=UPI00313A2976